MHRNLFTWIVANLFPCPPISWQLRRARLLELEVFFSKFVAFFEM